VADKRRNCKAYVRCKCRKIKHCIEKKKFCGKKTLSGFEDSQKKNNMTKYSTLIIESCTTFVKLRRKLNGR
jgi:hypothetical protein